MGIEVVRGDVRNITDLGTSPVDAIIHLAGNVGVQTSIDRPVFDFYENTVSTVNMLEMARYMGIPLVFASTNKVYGDAVNNVPISEGDTRYTWDIDGIDENFLTGSKHHTPYGTSKLSGDIYCQEYFQSYGVKTVVNRMSCIYGEYQNGSLEQGWVDNFIRSLLFDTGDITIFGDGKQVRDVLWGGDVANLYLDELENIDKCAGEVFNVGGGSSNTLSLHECLNIIEGIAGKKFNITYSGWRDADQKIYISDIKKVYNLIGWKPSVKPEEGIKLMMERYTNESN
jgi:CDP-paratose 2-epimerase